MEAGVKTRLPGWALVAACILPFLGFWTYGLFDLDEGYYGAVVVDMIRRGDWITPTLNGVPWFEKPILAYWLSIPALKLFGEDVGPRLPSVLCTLATAVVLARFTRRWVGSSESKTATLVYCTNLLVVAIGRMMMTDAPLVLFLTVAMTCFFEAAYPGDGGRPKFGAEVSAFALGAAVLAKGPVAAVLFVGTVVTYGLWTRSWPRLGWRWATGTLVFLAVIASWYVPCYLQNGQSFVDEFLIKQNVGRFAGGDKAHAVPAWSHPVYYPVILAASFLPFLIGRLLKRTSPEPGHKALASLRSDPALAFLACWAAVPLLFFTVSGTKLPHYILPAVVPLSALLATALVRRRPRTDWTLVGASWSVVVFILAQWAFTLDWTNRMKGVQEAAKFVRKTDRPVYVYKIGGSGDTSISLTLRETSHPSILFYLKRPAVTTDDPSAWKNETRPFFILAPESVAKTDGALRPGQVVGPSTLRRIDVPSAKGYAVIEAVPIR
ncbi:MAG: glycosyltransferase family 39 protein [Armatimonadetes bacterium]|nr:glycosyltransferase family 39 protein [Armatimonadota bacterium]